MFQLDNLSGKVFNGITLLEFVGKTKFSKALWKCQCRCGTIFISIGTHVKNGHTRSCGCAHKGKNRKHGALCGVYGAKIKRPRLYSVWSSMCARCSDTNHPNYKNYGGRGIAVCKRWKDSFQAFFEDMGEPSIGLLLDRIDNNGHYCKDNCRWATRRQQNRNKRSNINVTIDGKTQCLKAWCEELKISPKTVNWRRQFGWSDFMAITTPPNESRKSKNAPKR